MMRIWLTSLIAAVVTLSGCAPAPSSGAPAGGEPAKPTGPTKITTVMLGDPGYFSQVAYGGRGRIPGSPTLWAITTALLTTVDPDGNRLPQLGTQVPTTTDGTWQVFPD